MSLKIKSEDENIQNSNTTHINVFFKLVWVMILALFVATPFKIEWLMRICHWTYILCNVVCFAITFLEQKKNTQEKEKYDLNFLLMIVLVVVTYTSLKFNGTFVLNETNIIGYMNFMSIPIAMCYASFIKIDRTVLKFVGVINIFISMLFIVLSRMDFAYVLEEMTGDALTLGYSNPNLTAMMIFSNTIFLLVVKELYNKHILKLLIILLIASNFYLAYLTQARSSFVAVIIVIFMYYLKNKPYRVNPVVTILCIVSPLIFIFGYTYLYEHHYFRDFEFLGKSIYSGREVYYSKIMDEIKRKDFGLIFGCFTEFQNTHNSALSLLRFFGVSGMIAYYVFIFNNVLRMPEKGFDNKISYTCFVSILAIYIQSCAESAVVVGGGFWIVIILSLYAIAGSNRKEIDYVELSDKNVTSSK